MNRYFFSLIYGVGVLMDEVNTTLTIKFKTGEYKLSLTDVFEIPDDITNNVLFHTYDNYFNYEYIKRAKEIVDEKRVGTYYIMGKTIKGKVYGTKEYETQVTFAKNNITCKCTCPVGYNCKHAYALIKTFDNDIEAFNQVYVSSEKKTDYVYNDLLDSYIRSKSLIDRLLISKQIEELLVNANDYDLLEILDSINYKMNKSVAFLSIRRMIIFNTDLFVRIKSFYSRLLRNDFCQRMFDDYQTVTYYIKSSKYTHNYELVLEYYFYKQEYENIVNEYLNIPNASDDFVGVVAYAIDKLSDVSNDMLELFDTYQNEIVNKNPKIVEAIVKKTKNPAYLTGNSQIEKKNIYSSTLVDILPIEKVSEIIDELECDNYLMRYIQNNFNTLFNLNKNKLAECIYMAALKDDRNAISLLNTLPHNYYLITLLKSKIDFSNIDPIEFFYYFIPSYKIESSQFVKQINYTVRFADKLILSIVVRNDEIINYSFSEYKKENATFILQLIINELSKNPEYKLFLNNYKNEVRMLTQSKKEKELSSLIDRHLSNEIKVNDKINLELSLYIDSISKKKGIELRVGNDKYYVVKDVSDFLKSITKKEVVSYGKKLTFNHALVNFDDFSQKIIFLLLMLGDSPFDFRDNSRRFGITDYAANEIIKLYKGHNLIINDNTYFIRLEERKAEYLVDKNYKIKCNLPFESFDIAGISYLYAEANNIDILKSSDDINFDLLMQDLIGKDISYAISKFKEDVYYKYQGLIKIDNELTEEFIINDVRIDAYFDYNDGKISVDTKLYKNDLEIDSSMLDKNDKAKVVNYINYLDNLGVHDNVIDEEEYIYLFFTMDFSDLRNICNVYLSESIKNKTLTKLSSPTIKIKYNSSIMQVFVEDSTYTDEELERILKAIKKKKKYVLLDEDRIIDINSDEATEFLDAVEEIVGSYENLSEPVQIPFHQAIKGFSHQNNTTIDEYLLSMYYELTSFKKAKYQIPSINAELRQYQKEGYYFLKILSKYNLGGILADDMGLGKTLEIITLLSSDDLDMPSIVICPKSLIFNWEMEIKKFNPELKVVSIMGEQKLRHRIISGIDNSEKIIYVTAYDSLRNDIEAYEEKNFNYIILDEAQFIKNVSTTKSKNVKKLKALHKFALTGTPIENNIIDLWSIFDFIMPGYLEPLSSFKNKFIANPNYEQLVMKKTKLFILRRTKKEVLTDLPEKYERIVSCDMTSEQHKLYDAYKIQARKAMEENQDKISIIQYLVRLRHICVDPNTFVEDYYGGSGKMEALEEIIDSYIYDGHKLLIFSSFVKALEIVEIMLKKHGVKYLMLTGDTKIDVRNESVRMFNSDKEIKVFLISLKAGGTGLNLTAADTVIHLDPWWNTAAMDQASDRAHRIGQLRNVEVIKLVCEDSIEQRVIELQNMKKDLIDKFISNDDSSITNFDLKDLGYILK